ncbi:MAG: hypothetical protein WCQ41_08545 [Bacillota bacterium]
MSEEKNKVNAGLSGKSEADLVEDVTDKVIAMAEYDTIVTDPDPTPAAAGLILTHMKDGISKEAGLLLELKQVRDDIDADKKKLIDIMVNKWAPQIQNTPNITIGQIHVLGFHVTGENPIIPIPIDTVPVVTKIVTNIPEKHILHVIDSKDEKKAVPTGMLRTDVFAQIGGTKPVNMAGLIANGGSRVGEVTAGKFIFDVPNGNKGKTVFYILTYIEKKTKKSFSYSIVYDAVVT